MSGSFIPAGGIGANFAPPGSVATDRQAPWQQGKLFFLNFGSFLTGVPLRVKGPALMDFQGYTANGVTYTPGAIHSFRYFVVPAPSNMANITTNLRPRLPLVNQGPYLFIPQGGDYVVFVDVNTDSNIVGLPDPATSGFVWTVTENYTSEMASIVMAHPPRVLRAIQVAHTCPNAVSTHLLPPSPSTTFGQQQDGHVCRVALQSNEATLRTLFFALGRDAAATDWSLVPLSGTEWVEIELGCGDSVNIFNTAAAPRVVSAIWFFQ